MKKILLCLIVSISTFSFVFAEKYSITNIIGGNSDKLEGTDFFCAQQAISKDDEIFYKNPQTMQLADRLQLDVEHENFESRIRLDVWNIQNPNDKDEQINPNFFIKGYGKLAFDENHYLSIVGGNSFFSKFDIKAAELFAIDTTQKNGKIIKSGLGLYSEIPFNKKGSTVLKAGTCIEDDTDITSSKTLKFGAGTEFIYKNTFYGGISARNITAKDFGKYGIYIGGKINDFKLNASFSYNNTDEEILPAETKYSVSVSALYKNDDLNFSIATDIVTGLNNEYLSSDKEATKTYTENGIPFMAALNFEYFLSKKIDLALNVKLTDMLNTTDNLDITVYPNLIYTIQKKKQELSAGTRLEFNKKTGTGLTKISIPVCYKIKFSN